MKGTAVLIALMGLTLGLTAFVAVQSGRPEGRVGGVGGTADVSELVAQGAAHGQQLDRIEAQLEQLERRLAAGERRRSDAAPAARAAPLLDADGNPVAAAVAAGDLEEAVAARVERTLEDKMEQMAARARFRGADGQWKPPIEAVTRELDLNEQQESSLRDVFDRARDEAFALLDERDVNDVSILQRFADDIRESGDIGASTGRFFVRLASENVPGRDQTHLQALEELGSQVKERAGAHLDDRQRQEMEALNLDVFDVKTGYDPIGDYIRQRMEQVE